MKKEAWEQRKLSTDIKLIGGATPFKDNPDYWNGDIVWLSSQEIKGKYVSKGTYTITNKAVDDNTTKVVKAGTPLIVTRSGILARMFPISIPTIDVAINQDIKALIYNHEAIDTDFIFAELQKNENFILKSIVKTGTTVQSVNLPDFLKFKVSYASINEQHRIGTFFKLIDNLLALHQRKLELLQQTKKGFLQRIFPQQGESHPQLRFKEFSEPWERRKLSDVARITMGQSPNSENYTEDSNNKILVQGNADMKNGRVVPRVWTTQITKEADKGDIILSVRAPVGDVGKTDYDVVLGRGVAALKGNEFIFQLLGKAKSDGFWSKLSTGSTFDSINSNDIKNSEFMIPSSTEEQQQIAAFFKQLDDTFTLHKKKIKHLKKLKKAYMHKMFI
ncbi:restriction endonuclease subunit S [Enterococcus hirae]|nr:restriction endonuclease subunit S [Enterococcus hirae]